jgi:amidophosphoribosyltransferase
MCGIAGLVLACSEATAAPELFETALTLQHRGQEASGIACSDCRGQMRVKKGLGLVLDVFGDDPGSLDDVPGPMGLCHGEKPLEINRIRQCPILLFLSPSHSLSAFQRNPITKPD